MESEASRFTWADIKDHNNVTSAWIVIKGVVYDVTKFLDEHPGGRTILLSECGKDGTGAFEDVGHSSEAGKIMKSLVVGTVIAEKQQLENQRNKNCCVIS